MIITIRTVLGAFFLALMTSVSAQALTIQSTPAGGLIKLSDSSTWEVSSITSLNIPCMSCYVQQHWIAGDVVQLVARNGNFGAYTHTMENNKDGVKAYVIRIN